MTPAGSTVATPSCVGEVDHARARPAGTEEDRDRVRGKPRGFDVAGEHQGRHCHAQRATGRTALARLAIAFGASALTHPVVWFVIPRVWSGSSYLAMVVVAEAFAWLAEALWLARFRVPRALVWSFAANAASVAVGLTLRELTGWP